MTQNFETEWIPYLDINDSILKKDSVQVPQMKLVKQNHIKNKL